MAWSATDTLHLVAMRRANRVARAGSLSLSIFELLPLGHPCHCTGVEASPGLQLVYNACPVLWIHSARTPDVGVASPLGVRTAGTWCRDGKPLAEWTCVCSSLPSGRPFCNGGVGLSHGLAHCTLSAWSPRFSRLRIVLHADTTNFAWCRGVPPCGRLFGHPVGRCCGGRPRAR